MRVSPSRRWDNILILGIIAFIALLNLPTLIKSYLLEPTAQESRHPSLFNPQFELQALHFSHWSLEKQQGQWRSTVDSHIPTQELVKRWTDLVGTEVTLEHFANLKPQLSTPHSIEAWYLTQQEPQRITYYQTPQFWLFKNWQGKWIAISFEADYLMPQ